MVSTEDILLSVTKSIRSFIFMSLSISVPFFLLSFGLNAIQVSLVLLFAIGISTFFIYFYTILRMQIKEKLVMMAILLTAAIALLIAFPTLPGLLIAIVIGAISLSGKDMATNQSLEQYTIGRASRDQRQKNLAFSFYNFFSYGSGTAASAFLYIVGAKSFQGIFLVLLILAAAQVLIYMVMKFPSRGEMPISGEVLPETRKRINTLGSLFFVDSLGGGLVNTSIIALWFEVVFHITLSQAGLIFIGVNLITAFSILLSSHISSSIGLVRTMVYTHIISNVFLFLIPVFHVLAWSEILLFIRQTTSQMDVPARDSFVNTVIPEDSRLTGNSTFLAVRNVGQVPGPGIAGALLEFFPPAVFMAAALTKISYDVAFYVKFRNERV
ncbi:MAG: MFS transporter [Candidatus Thermoplasmatota archaeon]|nr:MFS transporter [Candidatus Thermoplasmatota archaeon]